MLKISLLINGETGFEEVSIDTNSFKGNYSIDERFDYNTFVIPEMDKKEPFLKNTKAVIVEELEDGTKNQINRLVENDIVVLECKNPKRYNHTITLVEPTAILQQINCDSISITQPLGYLSGAELEEKNIYAETKEFNARILGDIFHEDYTLFCEVDKQIENIKNRISINTTLNIASCKINSRGYYKVLGGINTNLYDNYLLIALIYKNNKLVFSERIQSESTKNYTFSSIGNYDIYFYNTATYTHAGDGIAYDEIVRQNGFNINDWVAHYNLYVYNPAEPNPKGEYYSMGEVVDKIFNSTSTLREKQQPAYFLSDSMRVKLDDILAPEEYFTQNYAYENLLKVGKHIHAIPRIADDKWNEVTFDYLTATEETETNEENMASYSSTINAKEHYPCLISNVENAVSNINLQQATTVQDFRMFTSSEVRLTADNAIMQTDYPIYEIKKVIVKYNNVDYDITDYIVDKFTYSTLTKTKNIRNSIAYHIYYDYNNTDIKGLQEKIQESAIEVFKNPAMVNILYNASGETLNKTELINNWWKSKYKIEYMPIISFRTKQYRTDSLNYEDVTTNLVYNQNANIIDVTDLGENLADTLAKIGNPQIVKTYLFNSITDIPKIGTIDKTTQYYIANVDYEITPNIVKATATYSKDWNKLYEYIGVDSKKRFAQVDERQALQRDINIDDFVILSKTSHMDRTGSRVYWDDELVEDSFITEEQGIPLYMDTFKQKNNRSLYSPPKFVSVKSYTKNGEECLSTNSQITFTTDGLSNIILPIQKCAIGNSIGFLFQFKDNYSAGTATYNENNIYYNEDIPYSDYLGRIETLTMAFINEIQNIGQYPLPLNRASYYKEDSVIWNWDNKIRIKKDNREKISINYQINALTTDKELIIGSGLSKRNGMLLEKEYVGEIKAYLLNKKIDKFYVFNENDIEQEITNIDITKTNNKKEFKLSYYVPQFEGSKSVVFIEKYNVRQKDGTTKEVKEVIVGNSVPFKSRYNYIYFGFVGEIPKK